MPEQRKLFYLNNQNLFSNNYLEHRLPLSSLWNEQKDKAAKVFDEIKKYYEEIKTLNQKRDRRKQKRDFQRLPHSSLSPPVFAVCRKQKPASSGRRRLL